MITRNNYEEYFLLYTDNELSGAERKAVEEFAEANPDLKEELMALQQSVFKPDQHLVFENKESLMKHTAHNSFINQNNYEEYFLLYTDNELNETQKKEVELFAATNPALKEDLDILLQTRPEPDTAIQFKNKEVLFRKEKDERVIPIFWLSVAAAVAIILVLFFVFNNKTNIKNELVRNTPDEKNIPEKKSPEVAKAQIKINDTVTYAIASPLKIKQGVIKQAQQKEAMQNRYTAKKEDKQEQQQTVQIVPSSNLPEPNAVAHTNPIRPVGIDKSTSVTASADPSSKAVALNNSETNIIDKPADIAFDNKQEVNYALQAVQKENAVNADESFYIANVSSKKNSLRGLFRKVSRVLNKNANAEDDDKRSILIGSFQTSLK
ncbi:MAG: hypothetical protein JST96_03655 [Bacteroidetes bacterium]|nr:hypothetical protein [Bacteroidota bacterium]